MQLCRARVEGSRPAHANRFPRDPDLSRPVLRDQFLATCPSRSVLRDPSRNPLELVSPAARGPRCRLFSPKSAPGFTDVGLTRFSMSARRRSSARSLHPRCVRIGAASSTGDQLRSRRKFPFHPGFSVPGNPIPKKSRPPDPAPAFPSGRLIPDPASGRFLSPKSSTHPFIRRKYPCPAGRGGRRAVIASPPARRLPSSRRVPPVDSPFGPEPLPERRLSPRVFWTYPDPTAT
jgi:hypothetical protein